MNKYAKAISGVVVALIGALVTFGYLEEAQAQAISGAVTQIVVLIAIYLVPNAKA